MSEPIEVLVNGKWKRGEWLGSAIETMLQYDATDVRMVDCPVTFTDMIAAVNEMRADE